MVCFGENSPKKDSNWVKCWDLLSTAGSDCPKAVRIGGSLLDIIEAGFFSPFGGLQCLICVYLPWSKDIPNCVLWENRHSSLPACLRWRVSGTWPCWYSWQVQPKPCLYRLWGCKNVWKAGLCYWVWSELRGYQPCLYSSRDMQTLLQ